MSRREYEKISIQEMIYLASFLILFGARAVGLYEGQLLYNITLVLGLLMWGVKILVTEHSVLEYIIIGSLILLTLVVYKNTGEKGILLYFTMMLGMKNVSVKRVFKCGFGILFISYLVLIISSLLGINNEIMYIQRRGDWGDVFRHALGYPHPNTLHSTYVVLVVLIMYLIGKQTWKRLLLMSVILFGGSYYIYLYSGSRNGLLTTGIYLTVNFWFQIRKNISIIEKIAVYALYPACIVFSTIGPLVIKGKLFNIIDGILSTRWSLSIYYLENEPITLLGSRFKEPPSIHHMIDSSFLYSFLQLGVIPFIIITFLFLWKIHDSLKKESRTELAIIVSFCIMGIFDPFLFNLSYKNFVFLFIGEMLYDYLQKGEKRVPQLMKYPINILKIGNRTIKYPKVNVVEIKYTGKEMAYGIGVFILTAVCSITLYTSFTEMQDIMYVNKIIWDDNYRRNLTQSWEGQGEEVYFTNEEVKKLKSQGVIVVRYENVNEPMYKIVGDAPRMEYKRNVASVGFWSGVLVVSVYWLYKQRSKKNEIDCEE